MTQHASPDWLRVARIVRPQGHRGEVLAELLTDFPERFAGRPAMQLRLGEAAPLRTVIIETSRPHQGRIVLSLSGCATMNDAEALRGYDLVVPWECRAPLAEDEVYVAELAGCTLTDTRTGTVLGVVADVDRDSGPAPLLVIAAEGGRELLVPFVKAFAPRWDLEARTLSMRLPEGLAELDAL